MDFNLQWYEYVLVAGIVLAMVAVLFAPFLYLVRRWEKRRDARIGGPSLDGRWELEQDIRKLKAELNQLRQDFERKELGYVQEITTLKAQVATLFDQWAETIRENHNLQTQITTLQTAQTGRVEIVPPLTPLLLVCGDRDFCEQDADRLNQTGIYNRQLNSATRETVAEELQRRRLDGTLYWWLHISAHGSAEGIQLADGLADARFWNRHLEGIRIVFLASCDGPEVADLLIGVVRRVIVFYGDINSDVAALFTLAFWRAKKRLLDADLAYEQAIREVPAARAYVDLRRS